MKQITGACYGISRLLTLIACLFAAGCAAPVYTVDDGSEVDEKFLSAIRLYGKGEQTLRPAIVQSAALQDEGCSKQWELPFVVASSYQLPKMEKIAWVRGLQVDERLTIVAAAPYSGLKPGDKIEKIDGDNDDPDDLLKELMELREDGDEFSLTLSDGRTVKIKPVEVCRGRVELTKPAAPDDQNYHWLNATHPMSVFRQDVTADEAMWMVLWTQGMSEEAGMRMKTYHYGLKFAKTALTVASVVSGVGAAAGAAQTAAASIATSEAGKMAAQAAGKEVAKYAAEQVADSIRKKMLDAAVKEVSKAAAKEIAAGAVASAGLFKSSLSGISWVAGTGFWMADKWALDRMQKLGADPLAAYTLHQKLASAAQADNAFVFDEERLANMMKYAQEGGYLEKAEFALSGETAQTLAVIDGEVEIRPLESAQPLAQDVPPVAQGSEVGLDTASAKALDQQAGNSTPEIGISIIDRALNSGLTDITPPKPATALAAQ